LDITTKPRFDLAKKTLSAPLLKVLKHIFLSGPEDLRDANPTKYPELLRDVKATKYHEGCGLVGGTALAGFYAAHRKSDDLDFFTASQESQKAIVLAVKSCSDFGLVFHKEFHTAQYYKATCSLNEYNFTIDTVCDPALFKVGTFENTEHNIRVANLETLLMTKSAVLLSRCSEKDLYDVLWLLQNIPGLTIEKLLDYGSKIDAGLNGETLLLSVSGAIIKEEACGFFLEPMPFKASSKITKKEIFTQIQKFKNELCKTLSLYLKNQPVPELADLIKKIKKLA